jgi:hypothetical protein
MSRTDQGNAGRSTGRKGAMLPTIGICALTLLGVPLATSSVSGVRFGLGMDNQNGRNATIRSNDESDEDSESSDLVAQNARINFYNNVDKDRAIEADAESLVENERRDDWSAGELKDFCFTAPADQQPGFIRLSNGGRFPGAT